MFNYPKVVWLYYLLNFSLKYNAVLLRDSCKRLLGRHLVLLHNLRMMKIIYAGLKSIIK